MPLGVYELLVTHDAYGSSGNIVVYEKTLHHPID
jgi:hypothetical protein